MTTALASTTFDGAAYDFSGRYTPASGPTFADVRETNALLASHQDMFGFVSQHCRPAVSAMVAYAEYLLAVVGPEIEPERRALLELIRRDGSDLLRGISAVVGPTIAER